MAKVVQFLEIGNLPKSQLNACPYRKVMIKNLFLSISKSGSARNFHTIFEFSLQISRSHGPPVFRLSQMQKLHAKSREFRPNNCAILAPNARTRRGRGSQKQCTCLAGRVTPSCDFRTVSASAARVSCAKSAPNFIETSAIPTKKSEGFAAKCAANNTAELNKRCACCAASTKR